MVMSGVRKSAYRQPVTPKGLAAIESGSLTWLDEDMYNNLNTGLLEQYLEEKNLEESFEVSHWSLSKVMIGIGIGALFFGYFITNEQMLRLWLGILSLLFVVFQVFDLRDSLSAQMATILILFTLGYFGAQVSAAKRAVGTQRAAAQWSAGRQGARACV